MDPIVVNPEKEISALEQAAEDFGIEHQYWDIFGKQHQAGGQPVEPLLFALTGGSHGQRHGILFGGV
jgi:hypothetical protein